MAKIFVEAYGCSASFADSEMISGLILNGGHTLAVESLTEQVTTIFRSESEELSVKVCPPFRINPEIISESEKLAEHP